MFRIAGSHSVGQRGGSRWAIEGVVHGLVVLFLVILISGCARKQQPTPAAQVPVFSPTAEPASAGALLAPVADPSGLPNAGALPEPSSVPQVYVVQRGDTLYGIARRFGCEIESLIEANQIADPNSLQVGQELQVPSTQIETSPALRLLPDSEFVYGPSYVGFDVGAFAAGKGGYLAVYQENIDGQMQSGAEIIELVAHHYSVGPRMLLALLEMESGWVTTPSPGGAALTYPMGYTGGGWEMLYRQLAWAADELNKGYYDWRGRGMSLRAWGDGMAIRYASSLNAGTVGLMYYLSLNASKSEWATLVGEGPGSFLETYRGLFGDPAQYAIEPLVPANVTYPTLALPWSQGELWYYTGGPHGGWNDGSAWAALDFVPAEGYLGCQVASSWATAVAPGLVIYSQDGEVMVDLDGDGHEQTGWVIFYLHVAAQDRVAVGTRVEQGDPIGHPSCEGGYSEATHLHLARKYNGEWIAADGPLPLVLSGWQAVSSGTPYEGTAIRDGEVRTACECRDAEYNGLVADR